LRDIVPTNRMRDVTDAAHGVAPNAVAECARVPFVESDTERLAPAEV
jgi:hypothetical protein